MSVPSRRLDLSLLSALLLVVLLVVLGSLQYRWVSRVSEAEGQRMATNLAIAGERFTADFDRELTRLFVTFLPAAHHGGEAPLEGSSERLGELLSERLVDWQESSPYPEMLREILIFSPRASPDRLVRLVPGADGPEEGVWDAELRQSIDRLRRKAGRASSHSGGAGIPELPGLLMRALSPGEAPVWIVLRLDPRYLEESFLPELAARHFRFGDRRELDVTVRLEDSGKVLFHAGEAVTADAADLDLGLFRLRPFPELRTTQHGFGAEGREERHRRGARRRDAHDRAMQLRHHLSGQRGGGEGWRLLVVHRAGSLEALVVRTRRHNLALSLGILLLLAAGVLVTVLAARRAQRLARQQIELVAGVTHELYTPLAAIRSAGQNLADGVVAEPAQVRRYGSLVETEGRRLSVMVSRMLELAGLGSGQRALSIEAIDAAELVGGALEECHQLLETRGVETQIDVPPALPKVAGDREALRRAVVNLIENAVQHGGEGGWIGVRGEARGEGRKRRVALIVEDRGPGIAASDLPHLFEPFYRGRAVSSGVHGSGLGLALVQRIAEAHGGRVSAGAAGARGARFTLLLRVAESS